MKTSLFFLIFTLMWFYLLAQQIPSSYDLRDSGYVTSVKNQQGGTCWAHGTVASIESNLLINGNWQNNGETGQPNLAEYHLDWWNGFNQYYNADLENPYNNNEGLEVHMGGDYLVASAYFSRGDGFVREVDGQSYDNPPPFSDTSFHYYYPRDVEWFTMDDSLNGIDSIKKAIMTYGAVATCMYYDYAFIDNNYNHYQPPTDNHLPNHSIAIVGWDDNHNVPAAPHPGAWLCKNSWGSDWGLNGYFWISYYDKWACREPFMGAVSFHNTVPFDYDIVYYHDYHGWRDTKTDITQAMNHFHSREEIWIKSVSFFTAADSVDYTVKIYKNFVDTPSYLLTKQSGYIAHRGFHTIDLKLPVKLHDGMDFYVYLYLSHGGQPYDRTSTIDVLMDYPKGQLKNPVLVRSSANPDESYYYDGSQWQDFYYYQDPSGYQNSGNFTIKALGKIYNPQNLGAVFHIYRDNKPLQGALVSFGSQTQTTDKDGAVIFTDYSPNTQNIPLQVSADGINYSATYSIADTVLIADLYFTSTGIPSGKNIIITPNPAYDYIDIFAPQNALYQIFNLNGKILRAGTLNGSNRLYINNLPTGVYIVRITTENGIWNKKIVKN